MKLDILVLAAHPDDAELSCCGTILSHLAMGMKVGIVDFTQGELGTRGTPQIRAAEATEAAKRMGLSVRENLGLEDGFFRNERAAQLVVASTIRNYQPRIVLANAITDRHPDHGKGSSLASDACFLSGLRRVETLWEGEVQAPWRPEHVYHYIQDRYIRPDFVVDVSAYWEQKLHVIRAFRSQFHDPEDDGSEPATVLSSPDFVGFLEARSREFGHSIGVQHGEGFTREKQLGVRDLFDLI